MKSKILAGGTLTLLIGLAVVCSLILWQLEANHIVDVPYFSFTENCWWMNSEEYICLPYLSSTSGTEVRIVAKDDKGFEMEGIECEIERVGSKYPYLTASTEKHCTGSLCTYALFDEPPISDATMAESYSGYCECGSGSTHDIAYFSGNLYINYIVIKSVRLDCPDQEPDPDGCTDTDGGANWYKKGTVYWTTKSYTDICSGDGETLYEYYCLASGEPDTTDKVCLYGCVDGACKETPSTTTTTKPPTPTTTPTTQPTQTTTTTKATTPTTLPGGGGVVDETDWTLILVSLTGLAFCLFIVLAFIAYWVWRLTEK